MRIYNSLTRKVEDFKPTKPSKVGMYTCGPTVYYYLSVGNYRTFVTSDLLRRTLELNGYKIQDVMNITDVGHLTGDGDLGEDKLAEAAKREKKTAWDIAKYYTDVFLQDIKELNIKRPDVLPKATDHIIDQVELIKDLEKKGFTYRTSDGIYFSTIAYENKTKKKYGELSTLDEIKEGARVEKNPEKRDKRDFALWKFAEKLGERHMEWDSPWGIGFPGWHIECSAMSMKYLGESFDLHVGGEDLRQTHHPNEIAQSEASSGKKFVKYWVHSTFLLVDGKRMGKSLGNIYSLSDIKKKGYDPISLRYLYLTAHYRDPLNFTWRSLESASKAYERLKTVMVALKKQEESDERRTILSDDKLDTSDEFRDKFIEAVNNDLNMPKALALVWKVIKSNIASIDKYELILFYDEVFGLGLRKVSGEVKISVKVKRLLRKREEFRKTKKFKQADRIRKRIEKMGYKIEDTQGGIKLKKTRAKN